MKAYALFLLTIVMSGYAADPTSYDVTGVIRAPLQEGSVLIAHDEIPGFMAAMTMAFDVADRTAAARLRVDDRVRFKLLVTADDFVAADFVVIGRAVTPSPTPRTSTGKTAARLREGDVVPDFQLITEAGQPLTSGHLTDKYTVLTFIFTRCPVPEYCPALAQRFGALQKILQTQFSPAASAQVRLLSITLDPEFDRPEILAAYGEAVGADPTLWNFATGDKEVIDVLTKAISVYTERNGITLDHTLCTALIGPDGRVTQIWRGNGWALEELTQALRLAVK